MKKLLLTLLLFLPISVMAQNSGFTIATSHGAQVTAITNLSTNKYYVFHIHNSGMSSYFMSTCADGDINIMCGSNASTYTTSAVWRLVADSEHDGCYKLCNLDGLYLGPHKTAPEASNTSGRGTRIKMVGEDEAAVFVISKPGGFMFKLKEQYTPGYPHLHFDTQDDYKGFYADNGSAGANSQFDIYEIDKESLNATAILNTRISDGYQVENVMTRYYVTDEQAEVLGNSEADLSDIIATMLEIASVGSFSPKAIYTISSAKDNQTNSYVYVEEFDATAGKFKLNWQDVSNTGNLNDRYCWMVYQANGGTVLYNVGANGIVHNHDIRTSTGDKISNTWESLQSFNTETTGFVVISQINANNKWRIKDTECDGEGSYMNLGGTAGSPYVTGYDGATGNGGSHWYFTFRRYATNEELKAVEDAGKVADVRQITTSIGNLGFATMYYGQYNLIVPEGVNAWTFEARDGKVYANKTYTFNGDNPIIPAATGVLLQSPSARIDNEEKTYKFWLTTKSGNEVSNLLKGSDETKTFTEDELANICYLSKTDDDNAAFYRAHANFSNAPHKAYLDLTGVELPNQTSVIVFSELFGDETGIENVAVGAANTEICHDLSGRRVANPAKGLYIVNGKKYMIK